MAATLKDKIIAGYPRAMLVVACFWFAQLYCTVRHPYINLARYAAGQERMPFQGRDLMRWPMLAASHSAFLQHLTAGRELLRSPEFLVMELAAAISLLLAGWAALKLYRLAAPEAPAPELPFALLIVICLFDFVLTVPYSFPYDLPATAFLGWGTYFAMRRRFWALLPVFLFGTWNRETTLFVIGVVLIAAAVRDGKLCFRSVRPKDWLQTVVLFACWLSITQLQKHHYAANVSEAGPRIAGNLHALANPLLWPNILSASAFLLPYIFFNRHKIAFAPLRASLLLLPFWVLLLLSVGQILELRIYGDVSVFVAVAAALIFLADLGQQAPTPLSPSPHEA
ncbi:MAG: hypothetical protein LC729_00150 [Acidobacteria bacterium]|nr:hypothetical protein [Acidobacteriota bacterium]